MGILGNGAGVVRKSFINREEYLNDSQVNEFIEWLRPRVSGEEAFNHSFCMRREKKNWSCDSLWNAFREYEFEGDDFNHNQEKLDRLSKEIHSSITTNNNDDFVNASIEILKWGNVTNGNVETLENLGNKALYEFRKSAKHLEPRNADTSNLKNFARINSGWTKVYSLMLDDFPIYDSRVGTALGYLVREYCLERKICAVPTLLKFGRPPYQKSSKSSPNRNPSWKCNSIFLHFPTLSSGQRRWAECNVWAAWVLGEVQDEGKFGSLDPNLRVCSLEAALFMIGYEIPNQV